MSFHGNVFFPQVSTHSSLPAPATEKAVSEATDTPLWRYTMGRVSCAVRIPFYAIAAVGLTLKAALITSIALLTCNQGTFGSDFTLQAAGITSINALSYLDRIGSSALSVLFAPPENYRSLDK